MRIIDIVDIKQSIKKKELFVSIDINDNIMLSNYIGESITLGNINEIQVNQIKKENVK